MKSIVTSGLLLAAVIVPCGLDAQSTPPPPDSRSETTELSPFEVTSDRDYGYRAANSITATRMASSIQDTALAISVVTGEFLKDVGGDVDLNSALRYVASVQGENRNDGASRGAFGVGLGTIRGFPVDAVLRNGVYRRGGFTMGNVERIEVLKGPVSVLFGSAQPGGTINYITRRATFRREARVATQVMGYLSRWDTDQNSTSGYQTEFSYQNFYRDKLAWRAYVRYADRNGWHDHETFRNLTFQPSITYRPFKWLSITAEYDRSRNDSNPAGATAIGNPQFAQDYASPPADVLAFHSLTPSVYRSRIFGNSTAWRDLSLQARDNARPVGTVPANNFTTGATVIRDNLYRSTGMGWEILPHNLSTARPSFNFQGRGHYIDTVNESFSAEVLLTPASWIKSRYVYSHSFNRFANIHTFRSEINGPYTYGMATGNGGLSRSKDTNHQADLLFTRRFFAVQHSLVLGVDHFRNGSKGQTGVFNYASAPAVVVDPAKINPNLTIGAGNTLSGANALNNWDPLLHGQVPDSSGYFVGWGNLSLSDTRATGRYTQYQAETRVAGRKVILAGGFRREDVKVNTFNPRYSGGDSNMVGLTVGLTDWLNAYVSKSENYRPNAPGFPGGGLSADGVGRNRDVNGFPVANLVEDELLPDQLGKGMDVGLKVSTHDGVWSATLAWFEVQRSNIRVRDVTRSDTDPRNRFGTLYPQRFLADGSPDLSSLRVVDAGFQPVTFFRTTGNNINQGVEVECVWTPLRNFQVMVSVANIYQSKLVNPALTGAERDILYNRRLALSPEYQGSFFGKYTFTAGRAKGLSLGAGARAQTETIPRYDSYGDSPDFHAGFVVADLNLGYAFKAFDRNCRTSLIATNITDRLYSYGNFAYAEPRKLVLRFEIDL